MTGAHGVLPSWAAAAAEDAAACHGDVQDALELAARVGSELPAPGEGGTWLRWRVLAALAGADLTVARVVEAHSDALAIRHEAGLAADGERTWGVFAAESAASADPHLRAEVVSGRHLLSGFKPWCSLGGLLDAALVTAHDGDRRRLFAVDLHHDGVHVRPAGGWVARGLSTVVSVGIDFTDVPAEPVGPAGWYLARPGFAWGGLGVAACWWGGAQGVAAALSGARPGDITDLHVGRVDLALHAAGCVLQAAAQAVDDGSAGSERGATLALRVRSIVADACETVLREVGHATGPAPLAFDAGHAARVADLELYLRQHHGERDVAALGKRVRA